MAGKKTVPQDSCRRALGRLSLVAGLTLATSPLLSGVASQASADQPASIARLGRWLGVGWGDGYHVCRDGGCRPGADLPPEGYPQQFGPQKDRGSCGTIYPASAGIPRLESSARCDANGCDLPASYSSALPEHSVMMPSVPMSSTSASQRPFESSTRTMEPPTQQQPSQPAAASQRHWADQDLNGTGAGTAERSSEYQNESIEPREAQSPSDSVDRFNGEYRESGAAVLPPIPNEPVGESERSMPVQIPSILDNENLLDEPGSLLDREPSGTIEELPAPAGQHENLLDAFLRGPVKSNASTAVGQMERAVVSAEVTTVQANPFFPQTVLQPLPLEKAASPAVAPRQSLPDAWGSTAAPRVATRPGLQVQRLDPVTGIHPPRKPTDWNPVIQP